MDVKNGKGSDYFDLNIFLNLRKCRVHKTSINIYSVFT